MRGRVLLVAALAAVAAVAVIGVGGAIGGQEDETPIADAAQGKLRAAKLVASVQKNGTTTTVAKTMPFFSGGLLASAKSAFELDRGEGADEDGSADLGAVDLGTAEGTIGCSKRADKGNRRVNQDCTFRRQAEEDIAVNPANQKNLIAGQNDSRVGFNQCGIDWSNDSGRHWGDLLPPFRGHLNEPVDGHTVAGGPGTGHTYDAGSDPTVAFDADGRGYFSCVVFDINSNASGIYVVNSPKGANGAFYFNIPTSGARYMAVEDNEGITPAGDLVAHDKQFIVADAFGGSPNKNNVYVTWTVFFFNADSGNYSQSPIYGSMSTDQAQTWSAPEEISGSSETLCFFGDFFNGAYDEHACNFDQGSDPIVLPNGDLVVVFNNGNTETSDGQQLAVQCHPSGDSTNGSASLGCDDPIKVGDDVLTGSPTCDFGRGAEECIVGPFIRSNDFPRIGVSETSGNVYVAWQDYRNGEFDIQLTRSTDGGATWSPSITANPDTGLDHYMPAVDVAEKGNKERVAVSYYRSETGPPQGGSSDYVVAGGEWSGGPLAFKVVSPAFPPPDGIQAGFNGDYSGLAIGKGDDAHPIWSDTRNVDPFAPANGVTHDEDIFTDKVNVPSGKPKTGPGKIGKD